jgi:hypothetical protein
MKKAPVFFAIMMVTAGLQAQTTVSLTPAAGEIRFDDYFLARTLRVDYLLGGDHQTETVFLNSIRMEPHYGGPRQHLIDTFNSGTYRYAVYDSASGEMIFSRGFSTLFQEWRGTPEAKKTRRAYPMSAVLPYPKNTIQFTIDLRNYYTGQFERIYTLYINPNDYFIFHGAIHYKKSTKFIDHGDPATHVDIAFVAEGYTKKEMRKFRRDALEMAQYFLSVKPYSDLADKLNFYAIESASEQDGVNIPGQHTYVNTDIHSSFYTFDMDRYLTTSDTWSMYDIAANVPYDVIVVLNNSSRYGGGGFYNHYCQSTVDNPLSKKVCIHEFGHCFGGLADEYYTSQVTYSDFYNLSVEPWERNITTNVDFSSKWKDMISPDTPIPTPREEQYKDKIGMFEGGGYVAKGVYSPMMDCRMNTNDAPGFCPVCQKAIRDRILFICE